MRWFWQRRKRPVASEQSASATDGPTVGSITPEPVQRSSYTSGRLGQPREITDELLLLARDYLHAIGGRVRVEDEDVLSATLSDGTLVRYTTSQAKAREDGSMTLLIEGSESLTKMLDDIATRARVTSVRLAAAADPVALALEACAAPHTACGRCLDAPVSPDGTAANLCATCPRRDHHLVLRWRTTGPLAAHVEHQEQADSVEFAYLMMARDRQGRRDEWMRYALDITTGRPIPTLSESALARATANEVPDDYAQQLIASRATAERALLEPLVAAGLFLRQRSLNEYQRRLDEVATTFDRLQGESPEVARAAKHGRKRELAALADVYAVDIEAQLESLCFVTSPYAVVAVRPRKARGDLLLHVDLGRSHVIPPACESCGADVLAGFVCEDGHVMCVSCAAACSRCGAWACATCGESSSTEVCAHCGQAKRQPATVDVETTAAVPDGSLTAAHLDVIPPDMWLAAVDWLLARQAITTESRQALGDITIWQGHSDAGKALIASWRPRERLALDEITVRQVAAHLGSGQPVSARMLITTAPSTAEAWQAAQQLGINIVDRTALNRLLADLASAYTRERARQHDEMRTRADAATIVRQAMLDAVDSVEHALAPLRRTHRRVAVSSGGATADRALANARNTLERAALAWDTLLADWTGSFGERADRAGHLVILAESDRFTEMAERAAHLHAALAEAVALLAATPAQGEPGYTTWRQAILDECDARCEAWRWRIRSYDPASWSDFARAWNMKAATKAAEADSASRHATARADKAQAPALRAG